MDAIILVVGDEILAGRTPDTNSGWLARQLTNRGIRVSEIRAVPDTEETITAFVAEHRADRSFIFIMGGIGPTHDDVTRKAVARGLDRSLVRHAPSVDVLRDYYKDGCNEARLRMALVPEGAELIPGADSAAPGFRVGHLFVLAGVPEIMRRMFEGLAHTLPSSPHFTHEVYSPRFEGAIADSLAEIQERHPEVSIGCYPSLSRHKAGGHPVKLVVSSTDESHLRAVLEELRDRIPLSDDDGLGADPDETRHRRPEP